MPEVTVAQVEEIARQHDLPEIISRLLVQRGVKADAVESFLTPTLAKDFPDPMALAGMKDLSVYLAQAIETGRKIAIFGDFDVDGATSTAIMVRFLRHFNIEPEFYIPDRIQEGYGPNIDALTQLKDRGAEIVIICDCGITAFDVIEQGSALGLDIIVLDHHEAEDKLPDAVHVIDPKRKDDHSGYDMLAACGVVFLTCVATNTALREAGYYKKNDMPEPPLKDLLDLVALGTVCDIVPLIGPNRLFVRTGLEFLTQRKNLGVSALAKVTKLNGSISPYHLGFILGPRINAGSRIHKADLGANLLSTRDDEDAQNIAWTLNDCNDKRKEIEAEMFDQAIIMAEEGALYNDPIIIVGHKDWHPGLSGLVAGRLKEKYKKPAVAITYAKTESGGLEGRGSGRSVPGIHIGQAFIDGRNEGVLIKGGGHAMAAGFTLDPEKENELREFLFKHVKDQAEGKDLRVQTPIDGVLSIRGASVSLVNMVHNHIGPFGEGNPEPLFMFQNVRLHMVDVVGKDHVRAMISDWEGGPRIKAMAFRSADTPLGQAMIEKGRDIPFHILGTLKVDDWSGTDKVEIHIKDAFPLMGRHISSENQQVA